MADIFIKFLKEVLRNIPTEQRGSTTRILEECLHKIEEARNSNDVKKMKGLKDEMSTFGEELQRSLVKREPEDEIIMPQLFGLMMLQPQFEAEELKFMDKINHASDVLVEKFDPEGFGRHEKLFAILTELKNTKSPSDPSGKILTDQLEELQLNYV